MSAGLGIPDHSGAVGGGGGDPTAVGGDAHLRDAALVTAQFEAGLEVGAEGLLAVAGG